jgi:hypothetical protein
MHAGGSINVEIERDMNGIEQQSWIENTTSDTIHHGSPGVIASATLNKLIERLTGGGDENCK